MGNHSDAEKFISKKMESAQSKSQADGKKYSTPTVVEIDETLPLYEKSPTCAHKSLNPLGAKRPIASPVLKSTLRPSMSTEALPIIDWAKKSVDKQELISLRPKRSPFSRKKTISENEMSDDDDRFPSFLSRTESELTGNLRSRLSRTSSLIIGRREKALHSIQSASQASPPTIRDLKRDSVSRSNSLRRFSTQGTLGVLGQQSVDTINIRSRIPCRNYKLLGKCQFGSHCHYRHDGEVRQEFSDEVVIQKILDIRKDIVCQKFQQDGYCEFGIQCYFKHCDADSKVIEETGVNSFSHMSLMRFQNPYGDGDICAAGVIPYMAAEEYGDGALWALFQVEDTFDNKNREWHPSLSMFGGKVSRLDADWLCTAAREFSEETGGLVGNMTEGIPARMMQFQVDEKLASDYTKFIEEAKFQCLYYPISKDDVSRMLELPARYTETFKGTVSQDWSRSATSLELVLLKRNGDKGWDVYDSKNGNPYSLPIKPPLNFALSIGEFPIRSLEAEEADVQDITDLFGTLESALNMNPL